MKNAKRREMCEEEKRLILKFEEKRVALVNDLYKRVNQWMGENGPDDQDKETSVRLAVLSFAEVCGRYAANFGFLNKKCDSWAESYASDIETCFITCYHEEMRDLVEYVEGDDGEATFN